MGAVKDEGSKGGVTGAAEVDTGVTELCVHQGQFAFKEKMLYELT